MDSNEKLKCKLIFLFLTRCNILYFYTVTSHLFCLKLNKCIYFVCLQMPCFIKYFYLYLKDIKYAFLSNILTCNFKDRELGLLLKIKGEGRKGHLVNIN